MHQWKEEEGSQVDTCLSEQVVYSEYDDRKQRTEFGPSVLTDGAGQPDSLYG